jgi:hypothetical protein
MADEMPTQDQVDAALAQAGGMAASTANGNALSAPVPPPATIQLPEQTITAPQSPGPLEPAATAPSPPPEKPAPAGDGNPPSPPANSLKMPEQQVVSDKGVTPGVTKPARPLTPLEEYQKSVVDAQGMAAKSVSDQQQALRAEANAKQAQAQAVLAAKTQAIQENQRQQQAEAEARRQAGIQADNEQRASAARAKDIAAMKVDTSMAGNLGPVGSVLGILAVAANGLFTGISKGAIPMFAVDMINKQVDRSVQAQKDQIQAAKDANAELDKQSNARYGRSMDMAQYTTALRRDDLNMALAQADNVGASLAPGVERAHLDAVSAGLQGELAKTNQDSASHIYTAQVEDMRARAAAAKAGAAGSGMPSMKEIHEKAEKLADDPNFVKGDGSAWANDQDKQSAALARVMNQWGFGGGRASEIGTVHNKEVDHPEQVKRTEDIANLNAAISGLKRLEDLNQQGASLPIWSSERRGAEESTVANTRSAVAKVEGLKDNPKMQELLAPSIPDVTTLTGFGKDKRAAQLATTREGLERRLADLTNGKEAPAAPAPSPAGSAATITVTSPSGVRGTIPVSQLQAALKKGYKQAE